MRRIAALTLCLLLAATASVTSCRSDRYTFKPDADLVAQLAISTPAYPQAKFIVFSDPHLYDPALGTEGTAFEAYLEEDRKLLRESAEIMAATRDALAAESVDFVLVTGDLTKDGEAASHRLMRDYLAQIEAKGKPVYVIPGNHDILNGHAFSYQGGSRTSVANVSPEEFAEIYADFGYREALQRDPDSLSYLVEPVADLWLLVLDSCLYRENVPGEAPSTDGRFKPETLTWIEQKLAQAASQGKAVIATLHHGVTEHYAGQEKHYSEYIVDDYSEVARMLASYGVRLVFSGHYHAQDITRYQSPDNDDFLFDIETGSLVTYPNPYRIISIQDGEARLEARQIQAIASHPIDFPDFSREYTWDGIRSIAFETIRGYKVKDAEAQHLATQVADAFLAHYAGDESLPAGQEAIQTRGLSLPGWVVITARKSLVLGLWQDLAPPDNEVTLDLSDGSWR